MKSRYWSDGEVSLRDGLREDIAWLENHVYFHADQGYGDFIALTDLTGSRLQVQQHCIAHDLLERDMKKFIPEEYWDDVTYPIKKGGDGLEFHCWRYRGS